MSKRINLEKLESVKELSLFELRETDGGKGFWGDVAYLISAATHFVGYMLVDAHNNPIRPSEYR